MKRLGFAVSAVLLVGAQGCANVQPYERGVLAKPEMTLDPDPVETKMHQATFTYKEGTSGGYGVGGGGCGCK